VALVCPTAWDLRQLAALRPETLAAYELLLDRPADDELRWDFDILAHIDARVADWRGRIAGVTSTSDYPGAMAAAAIARALGLPGPEPAGVLLSAHKYHSRQAQRAVAPEAVPRFRAVDPDDPRTWPGADELPCFLKPVKGSFSLFARHVRAPDELAALLGSCELADFRGHHGRMFDRLAQRYRPFELDSRWFLAEEPLRGQQVTLEAWSQAGELGLLGIVDTSFHPGTRSFARFDYPSHLPAGVQARMVELAARVARALALDGALFNLELFHDAQGDRIGIVEVNPRPCGQFADLYEKVDGTNGYEVALALACGQAPAVARGRGVFQAAASIPLRVFERVRVRRAPQAAELRAIEAHHPGSLLWVECRTGDELLSSPELEDGLSQRYAVLNLGGRDRRDIEAKRVLIERELSFEFEPVGEHFRPGGRLG
jgi:hypothetical protein